MKMGINYKQNKLFKNLKKFFSKIKEYKISIN